MRGIQGFACHNTWQEGLNQNGAKTDRHRTMLLIVSAVQVQCCGCGGGWVVWQAICLKIVDSKYVLCASPELI